MQLPREASCLVMLAVAGSAGIHISQQGAGGAGGSDAQRAELMELREDIAWGIQQVTRDEEDAEFRRGQVDAFFDLNRDVVARVAELRERVRERGDLAAPSWEFGAWPALVPEDARIHELRSEVAGQIATVVESSWEDPVMRRAEVDRVLSASAWKVAEARRVRESSEEARRQARDAILPDVEPSPTPQSAEEAELARLRGEITDDLAEICVGDSTLDPKLRRLAVDRYFVQNANSLERERQLNQRVREARIQEFHQIQSDPDQ